MYIPSRSDGESFKKKTKLTKIAGSLHFADLQSTYSSGQKNVHVVALHLKNSGRTTSFACKIFYSITTKGHKVTVDHHLHLNAVDYTYSGTLLIPLGHNNLSLLVGCPHF